MRTLHMKEQAYQAGTVIFQAGDPGVTAYLIRAGTVELLRGESLLAVLGPGEVFGEMSLIEERAHTLTARARSSVTAHGLTRDEFERLLTTDPAMFRAYLKTLFERLRILSAQFEGSPPEQMPPAGGVVVTIHPLTHQAAQALPENGLVIPKFPFRIGRASEAREHDPLDLNDMWLLDKEPFHVSRNHALLNLRNETVMVVDRGSKRGMYVNDVHIGVRARQTHAALEEGDNVVILGGNSSPYHFRVHVSKR
jgi:hypothetical protein